MQLGEGEDSALLTTVVKKREVVIQYYADVYIMTCRYHPTVLFYYIRLHINIYEKQIRSNKILLLNVRQHYCRTGGYIIDERTCI